MTQTNGSGEVPGLDQVTADSIRRAGEMLAQEALEVAQTASTKAAEIKREMLAMTEAARDALDEFSRDVEAQAKALAEASRDQTGILADRVQEYITNIRSAITACHKHQDTILGRPLATGNAAKFEDTNVLNAVEREMFEAVDRANIFKEPIHGFQELPRVSRPAMDMRDIAGKTER